MVCRFYLCQLYKLFQLQQPLLSIRTIGKACELTIGSDYMVKKLDVKLLIPILYFLELRTIEHTFENF